MADNRKVPSVPSVSDPVLRNFLSAVREAVNNFSASAGLTASNLLSTLTTVAGSGGGSGGGLSGLLDGSVPPAPVGLAVQGMRVNNFVTWTASTYSNLDYTEVWRAPALMDAAGMTTGGAYTIRVVGTVNWTSIGATAPAITSMASGTEYIITALGTINWAAIGSNSAAVVGSVFTYNGTAVTGSGGTVIKTAFTKNSTAITGSGGTVIFAPALSSAVVVGTSNGHIFVDSVDPSTVFAYWIRYVSYAGITGPYNSSTGTIGATAIGGGNGVNGWNITAENLYAIQAWISSADILDGQITNAKIGNTIQAANYSPSAHTGWLIDKQGNITSYGSFILYDSAGNVIFASGSGFNWNNVTGTNIPFPNATNGATIQGSVTGTMTSSYAFGTFGGVVTNGSFGVQRNSGTAGQWNNGYSTNSYTGSATCIFQFGTTNLRAMAGLTINNPASNHDYTTINAGIYCNQYGQLEIWEGGVCIGQYFQSILATDVYEISYFGTTVYYIKNGYVFRRFTVASGLVVYFDATFYDDTAMVNWVQFGQRASPAFVAPNASSVLPDGFGTFIAKASINEALIADANITTLKIAGNAVSYATQYNTDLLYQLTVHGTLTSPSSLMITAKYTVNAVGARSDLRMTVGGAIVGGVLTGGTTTVLDTTWVAVNASGSGSSPQTIVHTAVITINGQGTIIFDCIQYTVTGAGSPLVYYPHFTFLEVMR